MIQNVLLFLSRFTVTSKHLHTLTQAQKKIGSVLTNTGPPTVTGIWSLWLVVFSNAGISHNPFGASSQAMSQ